MAIERGTGASTAYATQRYAKRPARTAGPVGQAMTAKQRDFVATLVTQGARADARTCRAIVLQEGSKITRADLDTMAAEIEAPATIVSSIQATLNRTDISARELINLLITQRDAKQATATTKERQQRALSATVTVSDDRVDGKAYRTPAGAVYRVYRGQQSGRLLAKLWNADADAFEYAGTAARVIPTNAREMTVEELQGFGQATGTCAVCMRHLTDDTSVARGIGPVCWSKL